MRSVLKDLFLSMVMGLLVPGLVLNAASVMMEQEETVATVTEATEPVSSAPPPVERSEMKMRLRSPEGQVSEQNMDDYLLGVVLAEMPASFEPEALKAQAVVARTYARKAWVTGGKHGDGSVCTQSFCCQAYITETSYRERGGTEADIDKVRCAVLETSGCVLTYEDQLIEATYFSCSGGSTEDAVAVWGTDFPYLRAVSSPGEEGAANCYQDTKTFSPASFAAALGVSLSGDPASWFGAVDYTCGGGVESMVIGGVRYSGTRLRGLLGLRSTAFTVSHSDVGITFTTRGYGHRVGMSQYGADAMAASGISFQEILAHYYQGTELERWMTEEISS